MSKIEFLRDRFGIFIILICAIGIIFIAQLFNLQIVNGESYREQSEKRLVREAVIYAPRGEIYDRYGKVLATSEIGYSVQIYKTKITTQELNTVLLKLAQILEKNGDSYYNDVPIDFEKLEFTGSETSLANWKESNQIDEDKTVEEVISLLKKKYDIVEENRQDVGKIIALRYEIAHNGYSSYRPLMLAKNISEASLMEIQERSVELPGVSIDTQPIRKYTAGNVASHIIGYIGRINADEYKKKKDEGYSLNDTIGKAGIEYTFEDYLRGTNGSKRLEMDSYGRVAEEEEIEESVMGDSIVLTIDLDLQSVTEQVLEEYIEKIQTGGFPLQFDDARTGAVVVMNVKTGEVLAMASYPSYNPEDFVNGNNDFAKYFNNDDKPMFNRAIQGTYSPGSTFKMVTGIAALESGVIKVDEYVNDIGIFPLGHKPACWIWNSRRQVHGNVNAETALKVSCNFYYYEVASRMGIDKIAEYASKFGLGQKTGVELDGEVSGILASREYVAKLNENGANKTWTIGDTLSSSIGQSYNTFTPLQMCYYLATLANKGVKNQVTIVKDVIDASGNILDKKEVENAIHEKLGITKQDLEKIEISDSTLTAIFEGMRSVTGDSGGTAYNTFSSFPIEVAGKTGTATASSGSDNAWFVGFAPYDDPEIAVVAIIEHGGHGYYTAPAVKDIMEEYFGYNNNNIDEDLSIRSTEVKLVP